jgi:hypothetical protein
MTAFAFGRLARVNVFHHSPCNSVTLEHPFRIYLSKVPWQEPNLCRFSYTMLLRTCLMTRIEHSGLIMVNGPSDRTKPPHAGGESPCDPLGTVRRALGQRQPPSKRSACPPKGQLSGGPPGGF